MNFIRSLSAACNYYIPDNIINSQINYFAASDSKNMIIDNWSKLSQKPMIVEEVAGNHFQYLKHLMLRAFINNLRNILWR